MSVLRTAYVNVEPKTDNFDSELKRKLRRIDADKDGQRVGRTFGDGLAKGFGGGGTFARVAATIAARATLIGSAAAAAAPGVIHLTAALAPAAGALVALPAALAAVKTASVTFKIATAGVADAINAGFTGTAKQAKKALQELPPAARAFASTIIGLKPKVDALRASVAERFFRPMQDDIKPLVNLYFPMLSRQMANLAGPLGGLGEQFAQSARQARTFNAVQNLFYFTRIAILSVRDAINPLTKALSSLILSTAPMLPRLAEGFANLATRVSGFIVTAARSGQIRAAFEGALTTLRDLGAIAGNVGSILRSVFSAATAGGSSLLQNLRELTGQAAAFLRSAQGASALTSVFQTLGALGQSLRTSLAAVLPAIAESIRAIAPAVAGLAPAFARLVTAIAPLLPFFTQIAATVLRAVTPAIAGLANWLAQNTDLLKGLALVLGTVIGTIKVIAIVTKVWAGAQALLNVAMAANPIGIVIVALAALVAGVIYAYKHSETFRRIVDAAWRGIAAAAKWAWENVIRPSVQAMVAFFRTVIAPTVLWLWNNAIKPAWTGISFAVKAAWVVIQVALTAWMAYLRNVIFPVLRFLWNNVIKPVFQGISNVIQFAWDKVIKPVFSALGNFIRDKVAPAFRAGVDAIRIAWEKVRDAAKVPVNFVINRVINPLIGGFNNIAGKLGVKDRIPTLPAIGDGPGLPAGAGHGPGLPKHAGDGLGDVMSFITGPAKWLANKAGLGRIRDKFGNSFLAKTLAATGGKVVDWIKDKGLALLGADNLGRGASGLSGGLRPGISLVLSALRSTFGGVPLISGLRPGATTLAGRRSLHALGRAIDIPAVRSWAVYLRAVFGGRLKELITPWRDLNMYNGRPYRFSRAIEEQHGVFGRNAHIHAALDDGGLRVLRPGYNLIPNFTGAPEPIAGPRAMAAMGPIHVHLHNAVIASERQAVDLVVKAVQTAKRERRL